MAIQQVLTAGVAADGDYSAANPATALAMTCQAHRAVRVTDIDGNGRKWIESPSASDLGPSLISHSFTGVTDGWQGCLVERGVNDGDDEPCIMIGRSAWGGTYEDVGEWAYSIRITVAGYVKVYRARDSETLYDGAIHGSIIALPNDGDQAYIEVRVQNTGTSYTVEVYVDDVFDGDNSGTAGGTMAARTHMHWAGGDATANDQWKLDWRVADGYFDTTTRHGPLQVCYKPASVAGDLAEFTPTGAATNQACVDELGAAGDTDYNLGNGQSGEEQDALGHAGVGAPAIAIGPVAMVRRTGTQGLIYVGLRSNGTDQFGNAGVLSTTYSRFRGVVPQELDPDTGLAWNFNGTQDCQVTYKVPQSYTLSRTSGSGLLSRYEYDNGSFPFSTSDWNAPSEVTLSISSSKLRCAGTASAANRFIRNTAVSSQSEMMVYARMVRSTGAQMGVGALVSDNTPTSKDGIEASAAGGFSGGRFLVEWVANGLTVIDSTGSGINNSSPQLMSVWANATDAAMRDHNNGANESGTYSPAQTGVPAVYFSTTASINVDVEKFFSFIGRYVTVTGLESGSGQKAKLRTSGGTTLVSATESGGTATIDGMFVSSLETIDHIQITDANDVELGRSSGAVWPGETWAASGGDFPVRVTQAGLVILRGLGAPPDTPTITGAADGATAIDVQGSAYNHSQGVPIYSAVWQRALDSGFTSGLTEFEDTSPDSPPTHEWTGLSATTEYWLRVAYKDQNLAQSDWSDAISVTTETPPNTPTIDATVTGPRSIAVESSDYSHPASTPIGAITWQLATNAGFTTGVQTVRIPFASPGDAPDPLTYGWGDLEPSTTYWLRVKHEDEDGVESAYSAADSATTESEVPPTTPSIVSANPGTEDVFLIGSTYADPEGRTHISSDWQVDIAAGTFASPVNESLNDVSVLTSENLAGLTSGTAYKARVRYRADDGAYTAWSAAVNFTTLTTPANRPAQPTVSVGSIEQDTAVATSSAYSDPQGSPHLRTRWYVTNWPGGGTFGIAYRVLDVTVTTPLTTRDLTGLEPDTLYNIAVRYQATDGDWSDWSPWTPFTTLAEPLGGELLQIQTPRQGGVVRGAAVPISWTPASVPGSTFEIEYSIDNGISWIALASGITSSPYSWNVSGLNDGIYMIRVRAVLDDEVSGWQYRILVVDNANEEAGGTYLFNTNADDPMTLGDWEPAWNETGITWSIAGGAIRYTSPATSFDEAALMYLPAFEPRQVDVIGEVLIGSSGGSFPWNWFPEQAWAGVGVFAAGPIVPGLGPQDGVSATIYALPIEPFGDCEVRGSGDGFLEIAVHENGDLIMSETLGIGRVHVVNQFAGCSKVPRYGVRLRLTTIADLPGERRRLRVQASVTGRGVEPDESGWHFQGTVETGLDCGCAAFVARNVNSTTNPYRSFSNLTVIPYEYGSCLAPENFSEPTDVETCPEPIFDLTIFDDDEVTPLFGSVDQYGEIIEPSFSSDLDHPRPWLVIWEDGAEHEVDPTTGGSNVSTLVVGVVDKRTDPCDQQSGFLTVNGADANSFSAYIGRRAVARERLSDGTYQIVQNGPIVAVTLLDTEVTYQFQIASMREREREVTVFDTQYRTMSAYPWGPVDGYGLIAEDIFSTFDLWLVPPAAVARGTVVWFSNDPAAGVQTARIDNLDKLTFLVRSGMVEELGFPEIIYDDAGFLGRFWTKFIVKWRYTGETETDWNYLVDMPAARPSAQQFNWQAFKTADTPDVFEVLFDWPAVVLQSVYIAAYSDETDLLPVQGQEIEFQILANSTPSAAFPVFYDGPMGTLLRRMYDGAFSPLDPFVSYDDECMTNFEETGPWARLRIPWKDWQGKLRGETGDDLQKWVQKNIYQPSGWLPGLTEDGRICPVDGSIPDGAENLPTLDNAVVISANWGQDGSKAAPVASMKFIIENLLRVSEDPEQFDLIGSEVVIRRIQARGATLLKGKEIVIEPETVRTLGGPLYAYNPELVNDDATRLATQRTDDIVEQFAFGPQIVPVRVRETAVTRQLLVGSWCILDCDWIPNLNELRRGGQQLGLVIRRRKDPGLAYNLTLLLAGPGAPGLEVPDVGEPFVGDENQVCIDVNFPYEEYTPGDGDEDTGGSSGEDMLWRFYPEDFPSEAALRNSALIIPGFTTESITQDPPPAGSIFALSLNSSPPSGATVAKTLRYTYNHGNNGCTSITIQISSVRFGPVQEMYMRWRYRYSANFRTTQAACAPNDHKVFFGDTVSDESGRWAFYVGSDSGPNHSIQVERPRDPNGGGPGIPGFLGSRYLNIRPDIQPVPDIWDGDWHEIVMRVKHSTTTTSNDGVMTTWIDGIKVDHEDGFNTCSSAADGNGTDRADGVSFCHNKDDGPTNTTMTLDWAFVEVTSDRPGGLED